MSNTNDFTSREEILYSFAVEDIHDVKILKEYQYRFPEFAVELLELYHDLISQELIEESPESTEETLIIDAAWNRYKSATSMIANNSDPFVNLSPQQEKNIAKLLGIKRQVLIALQEHSIIFDTIPQAFLSRLSASLKIPLSQLVNFLMNPVPLMGANSYKSDDKPALTDPVSFEQTLIYAGHTDMELLELLSEDN